jgi:hypothetical protein
MKNTGRMTVIWTQTLNRNVICMVTICKSTPFKITLTVYHRVSAGTQKQGSRSGRSAFSASSLLAWVPVQTPLAHHWVERTIATADAVRYMSPSKQGEDTHDFF